jgi:hypothetical protein
MTKLADKGHATLPGGIKLTVTEDARKDILGGGKGMAERMSSYFQAAATEFANGKATYDFQNDTSKLNKKHGKDESFKGVDFEKAQDLNKALMGCMTIDPDSIKDAMKAGHANGVSRQDAIAQYVTARVNNDKSQGQVGSFIAVKGLHHHRAHMMLVTKIDDQGNFHVQDAHGKERVWTARDLNDRVVLQHKDKVGEDSDPTATAVATAAPAPAPAPTRRR